MFASIKKKNERKKEPMHKTKCYFMHQKKEKEKNCIEEKREKKNRLCPWTRLKRNVVFFHRGWRLK